MQKQSKSLNLAKITTPIFSQSRCVVHESKAITRNEAQYILLHHMIGVAEYWADESRQPEAKAKCSGTVFSLLVALDGGAMGPPGYELRESDVDFGGALHEHFHSYERGEHVCLDDPPRHEFMLEMVRVAKKYVDAEMSHTQRCQETMLDFLLVLDGEGAIPRPKVVPCANPDDAEYARDQGYDYYPSEEYDMGGELNPLAQAIVLGGFTKPEGLYDFGDHLSDEAKRMGY